MPSSSTTADVSRAGPVSIETIFSPAAQAPSCGNKAPARQSAGEPSWTASTSHAAIHINWEESSSEDEETTEQQIIGGQLWGPELFLAGYNTPAVWEMCNLQAAQRWQCPFSKGAGGTISCLDASRIDVVQLYDTGSARVAARLDATALRRSAASLPWQAAGRHDTVVTRHRRRHATAASSDFFCVPSSGARQRARLPTIQTLNASGGTFTTSIELPVAARPRCRSRRRN